MRANEQALIPPPPTPPRKGEGRVRSLLAFDEKTRFMLALIAPAVLVLILFQILPIITGTNASFRDWHLHDPKKTWIGLTNYLYVARDGEFLGTVLPNTFGFMF